MSKMEAVETRSAVEKLQNIEMVGKTSNRQVLQVFFYNMRFVYKDAKNSAALTLNAVVIFWEQARIPVRDVPRCRVQILKLYNQWSTIKKRVPSKRTETQRAKAKEFQDCVDDLFDISPENAFNQIKIDEDRQFLINQKKKGRPGCMIGVDMILYG